MANGLDILYVMFKGLLVLKVGGQSLGDMPTVLKHLRNCHTEDEKD